MLAIRLQRNGRSHYPTYRIIVQEAQRHPLSGRVVAEIGHYNPQTKETTLDTEKVKFYLEHGAQPSSRMVRILKAQKVALPKWVKDPLEKHAKAKHADKLRKNQPKEEPAAETAETTENAEAAEPTETSEAAEAPESAEPAAEKSKTAAATEATAENA